MVLYTFYYFGPLFQLGHLTFGEPMIEKQFSHGLVVFHPT